MAAFFLFPASACSLYSIDTSMHLWHDTQLCQLVELFFDKPGRQRAVFHPLFHFGRQMNRAVL
jgi:hypothetical protein